MRPVGDSGFGAARGVFFQNSDQTDGASRVAVLRINSRDDIGVKIARVEENMGDLLAKRLANQAEAVAARLASRPVA